jgi:hypothetical protein
MERIELKYLTPEQAGNIYRLALAQIEAKALEAWINLTLDPTSKARRALYEELVAQREVIEKDGAPWVCPSI